MSGGSYNYLCFSEFPDIMSRVSDLEDIEKELINLNFADIASDVRGLIEYCRTVESTVNDYLSNLKVVFHDIEWYCSSDIGKDTLIKTLELYRDSFK